ncbi:MAG: bifunctional chorismate mutase/prephenate dehydratase [Acidobacteriota bacterium]|jgi:chorismate mutase/prephenate dehydratase
MGRSLEEIRNALNKADRRIVDALAARHALIGEVIEAKGADATRERDELREHEVLAHVEAQARAAGLDPRYVATLFRDIIQHSVEHQRDSAGTAAPAGAHEQLRIGYQGGAGAYSYLAARQHFAGRSETLDCRGYRTFQELIDGVVRDRIDYAMLPVENTTAGSINEAYDVLARADVAAVGEEVFRVEHCLVALEPVPLAKLRRVASHPQALAQCSEFLATLTDCQIESYTDTAMAVAKVVRDGDPTQAAIASREAARRHGLEVLKTGIANQQENYTRFLVIARAAEPYPAGTPCKTSLVLSTLHRKAALATCLNVLADHDLNLTKLESRPMPDTPFEYLFYLDFEGNLADGRVADAVDELRSHTSYLKILGSYPAGNPLAGAGQREV